MDQALHVGQRAGLVREIASGKGGFKKKARKSGDQSDRIKKVPYGPARWGTLQGNYKGYEPYHLLPHQVGRQLQKSNAYKAKINSKVWKKGRAQ